MIGVIWTMEKKVQTTEQLEAALARISFAPSCVDFKWNWEMEEVLRVRTGEKGWHVRTSFTRPDTTTGKVEPGYGRWEYIAEGTTESGAIKTCWLLVELIVRHELMEGFLVDGVRIFNPHHSIRELSMPTWVKENLPTFDTTQPARAIGQLLEILLPSD